MTKKTTSNSRFLPSSDRAWMGGPQLMRRLHRQVVYALRIGCVTLCTLSVTSAGAHAQELGRAVSQIVTIDRQSLFSDTQYGRRVVQTVEVERQRLATETRKVEAALLQEERDLTAKRAEMTPEAFRALAKAFDEKVQALRAEGTTREQDFVSTLERQQVEFFEQVGPILGQLVRELGAVVILDRRAILLTTQNIDITKLAVQRIDEVLGDGADGEADTNSGDDNAVEGDTDAPTPEGLAPTAPVDGDLPAPLPDN